MGIHLSCPSHTMLESVALRDRDGTRTGLRVASKVTFSKISSENISILGKVNKYN